MRSEAKFETEMEAGRVNLAKKVTQNQRGRFWPLQRSGRHFFGLWSRPFQRFENSSGFGFIWRNLIFSTIKWLNFACWFTSWGQFWPQKFPIPFYYLMLKMVQLTQSVINDSIMNFLPNFALDAVSVRPPLLMHISGLSVYHSALNSSKNSIYI